MNRLHTVIGTVATLAGAAALAACSSSPTSTPPAASSSTSAPAAAGSSSGSSTGSVALMTASVGSLGTIVVNGQGMTVYRFDADSSNPPTSNCNGQCATYWPPVPAGSGTPQVHGVSASLLGTVTRSDGTKQLTLAGWPLYTYAGDKAAGDATGQGVNASGGKWWAVTVTGDRAGGSSGSGASSSPSSTGGGYGY
jgi:predicted lipoprotein with Yx(FWY)xxD motif